MARTRMPSSVEAFQALVVQQQEALDVAFAELADDSLGHESLDNYLVRREDSAEEADSDLDGILDEIFEAKLID